MTPHQIIAVFLRLVALVWVLFVVSHLHSLFLYLDHTTYLQINKVVVWVFAAIQIAVCALLWFFPRSIASRLLRSRDAHEPAPAPRLEEWQTLGVICIGLWALMRAIPDAVYWITFYNMTSRSSIPFSDFTAEHKAAMVETVVELILGFWLLFGAKGFAVFLFKARTAGREE